MRRWLLVFILSLFHTAYANVAVEQLNHLLAKKEGASEHLLPSSPVIKDLQENFYFVFIYRSTCPHCHKFAPVLRDFAEHFHVGVKAYSLDLNPIDGFKAEKLTPDLFQTFYMSGGYKPAVPALYLVNRDTLQAYAVLFGEATPYELAHRVNELITHIEEKFHD